MADDIQPADLHAELINLRAENEQLRTELDALAVTLSQDAIASAAFASIW